ncbi:hypothetical protein [Pedobacter sp. CFBP9032]|nr:hypothetical protein [Pedobacter sp. CFBP9032]
MFIAFFLLNPLANAPKYDHTKVVGDADTLKQMITQIRDSIGGVKQFG